ncbi:unnamed protein product, partial [Discosporangium mesarthrocarpum]
MSFIPIKENGTLCSVSQEWGTNAESDSIWRPVYEKRFEKQPGDDPCLAPLPPQQDGGLPTSVLGSKGRALCQAYPVYKEGYLRRLKDPQVGDRVEVAWRGKFRLESLEVFNGMAWWIAQVVEKDGGGHYKVHYPGWEFRWDEWVPRSRLRWGNNSPSPAKGDAVEMWCGGINVPGAWLEATVQAVHNNRLYLGEILTSGHFWVDADRVRIVKRCP